jgi:hypothetical protein
VQTVSIAEADSPVAAQFVAPIALTFFCFLPAGFAGVGGYRGRGSIGSLTSDTRIAPALGLRAESVICGHLAQL